MDGVVNQGNDVAQTKVAPGLSKPLFVLVTRRLISWLAGWLGLGRIATKGPAADIVVRAADPCPGRTHGTMYNSYLGS